MYPSHTGYIRYGKFACRFDQWLYMQDPDDSCGDSTDGPAWFGLYGKRILVEQSNGFVTVHKYPTATDARATFDMIAAADSPELVYEEN